MGLGQLLFGGSNNAKADNASNTLSNSRDIGLERAMKFAKKPPPKYSHSKKEAIQRALMSLERAVLSIDGAKNLLTETKSLFQTALESVDELDDAKRSVLAAQIERLVRKLISFVEAADINGLNLIDGHGSHLVLSLSEATTGQLVIRRVNLTPHGMGLADLDDSYVTPLSIQNTLSLVERALDYVTEQNDTFCANATILAEHYHRM
jgi:DNA-binding transcriptional MerR regulator